MQGVIEKEWRDREEADDRVEDNCNEQEEGAED
jgi:hypothetical protein